MFIIANKKEWIFVQSVRMILWDENNGRTEKRAGRGKGQDREDDKNEEEKYMQTIQVSEHGVRPNTDVTLSLRELFLRYPKEAVFVFEEGDYFFSPRKEMQADYRLSNSDGMPWRVLGLWMQNMEHCVLQGNGARLWFSGQMQPVTMDH